MSYEQIPIRIQLSAVSSPPVPPVDLNTGKPVEFWRAQDVSVQCALFTLGGDSVDVSNFASVELTIQQLPGSVVPLITKVVGFADITPTVSLADWRTGVGQQFAFDLSAAETDLGLCAGERAPFWMSIRAVTILGSQFTLCAGYIQVYNPGNQLPIPMPGIVSYHEQVNTTGNATVSPSSLLHKELVVVNGVARTSLILINPSGLTAGCEVQLLLTFSDPTVSGIVLQIFATGVVDPICVVRTDGYQQNARVVLIYNGSTLRLFALEIPAAQL